jgi:hypothetical protein
MGNTNSNIVKEKFGSIYSKDGITRPGYYWKKGNNKKLIYHGNEIILLPDENNFKSLKYGYFVTNLRVFYKGMPLLQANPKTFSTVTRNNIKSINLKSEKINELAKLNSVIGLDYFGNKKRVYHKNIIIYEE